MTTVPLNSTAPELRFCDREAIHIPGSIQPHGVLLTLDPESFRILQVSANVKERLGLHGESLIGRELKEIIRNPAAEDLIAELRNIPLSRNPVYVQPVTVEGGASFQAIAHRQEEVVVLELEPQTHPHSVFLRELYPMLSTFISRLPGLRNGQEVAEIAAEHVREITNFDRVLVYKFDRDWNGTVIAESRNEVLPSYLDLRFPASDIPSQARELYRLNPTRLIPDVSYIPSPLLPEANPKTGQPLDLSFAVLRSVSPIHREYMRNMGTAASMSISILREGELWGLISCHNREPKLVSFDVRRACEFIGQVVSVQTEAHEQNSLFADRVRLKTVETELLAHMAQKETFTEGMIRAEAALLAFAAAEGAAVLHEGSCALLGRTPQEEDVRKLVNWIAEHAPREDVFHTDCLSEVMPAARSMVAEASGLLALRISSLHDSYVLWFRPEVIQTVRWGGDPAKPAEMNGARLHPRKSFEMWKETVRYRSLPWSRAEIESAVDLRNAIVGIVLRKAEEMAELTAQLRRSNKELEAFSYSVSHDLRAPFRHIVGYSELLREREADHLSSEGLRFLNTIIDSAQFAGSLVDNLLNFSRIARTSMTMMRVKLGDLVHELQREFSAEAKGRKIDWQIAELPEVIADPTFLRLALRNLFSNAIKYSKNRDVSLIEIGSRLDEREVVVWIRDNGVGFDMRYIDRLFGVFQRLHRMEEYEGTGIGLANVRRIIDRHGGQTWAEGEPGKGATFYFSLPSTNFTESESVKANLAS